MSNRNLGNLGLTIVRKRAPIGTEPYVPRMLVERAELPEVTPESNPEYHYYPVARPRPTTALARYRRDKLALLERVKRELDLAKKFPSGNERQARIVSAKKVLERGMQEIEQAYKAEVGVSGMGAIYDAKRYQPHARNVGRWGPWRLTDDSTLDVAGDEVHRIVQARTQERCAMIEEIKARAIELRRQGMPMEEVRLVIQKDIKAGMASGRQAVQEDVRDLQKGAPRAEYDVESYIAPQEVMANPDYEEAVRDYATGEPERIPASRYFQPLPATVLPPVDGSPWTQTSRMEIGNFVPANPAPRSNNLVYPSDMSDYDYQRGYPYPLDLIETDMEKQGLMSYEIYERGWPYPPDLLWAEIERAGEDFGAQGMNSWTDEELMARYNVSGTKGLGAIETVFLL